MEKRIILRLLIYTGTNEEISEAMHNSNIPFHGERANIVSRYTSDAEVIERTMRAWSGIQDDKCSWKQLYLPGLESYNAL